ncbi:DNA alkylation repair protein [Halobacillus seohaensis]|uniref:DNA alkylation repair protein n=1 Tax=Halobacillus seohaensis TaxID=447421 RepID=A0ABW2ETL0_9BACI
MTKVKEVYNNELIEKLASSLHGQSCEFNKELFIKLVYSNDWDQLEFKQRVRRLSTSIHEALPLPYIKSLEVIKSAAPEFKGLSSIIFPDYIEQYGLHDWEESMVALKQVTQFSTSEFAVRAFLLKDQDRMLQQMYKWSESNNEHVRRLASEGSRPRLPWGQSVPSLKKNPELLLPLLRKLMEDQSLYVRKSVANHLNDISKTHPELVITMLKQWQGHNERSDWILRHASRTLLKQGNHQVLKLFGYDSSEFLHVDQLILKNHSISIGESLSFSFHVESEAKTKLRVEYAIDYVKKNGNRNRKVFQASDTKVSKGDRKYYSRHQSFRNMTTRKHYPGTHTLSIIINGVEKASCDFELNDS